MLTPAFYIPKTGRYSVTAKCANAKIGTSSRIGQNRGKYSKRRQQCTRGLCLMLQQICDCTAQTPPGFLRPVEATCI
jgi:hypothetical protein